MNETGALSLRSLFLTGRFHLPVNDVTDALFLANHGSAAPRLLREVKRL